MEKVKIEHLILSGLETYFEHSVADNLCIF